MSTGRRIFTPVDATRHPVRFEFNASWALFVGIGVLMLGSGLQGTLLGVRAQLEGFPTSATGVVMSSYYGGFLAGSSLAPKLLARVGHIRVFAALASLASSAVLVHAVFVTPVTWAVVRLVSGFCMAGLYVVAESWLNDRASNATRGKLLSLYMVVQMGGMAAGQLLLTVSDPGGFQLFVLTSVLVSLALVPVSLSTTTGPRFSELEHIRLVDVFRAAPLGIVGSVGTGLAHGAVFGMGAVYARELGMSLGQVSVFMGLAILGGVVLQSPIGHLSDRHDRRRIIVAVCAVATALALAGTTFGEPRLALLLLIAAFGGMTIPLYSLCIAHANDYLEPRQMVAASGSLIFASGIGSIAGPFTAAVLMATVGPGGFFWTLAAVHLLIGLYAAWRITRRAPAGPETWHEWNAFSPGSSPVAAALTDEHSAVGPDDEYEID